MNLYLKRTRIIRRKIYRVVELHLTFHLKNFFYTILSLRLRILGSFFVISFLNIRLIHFYNKTNFCTFILLLFRVFLWTLYVLSVFPGILTIECTHIVIFRGTNILSHKSYVCVYVYVGMVFPYSFTVYDLTFKIPFFPFFSLSICFYKLK